jgi:hypothetical protein
MKEVKITCDKCGGQDGGRGWREVAFEFKVHGMFYRLGEHTVNYEVFQFCDHCFCTLENDFGYYEGYKKSTLVPLLKQAYETFINNVWLNVDKVYETRWDCRTVQLTAA